MITIQTDTTWEMYIFLGTTIPFLMYGYIITGIIIGKFIYNKTK